VNLVFLNRMSALLATAGSITIASSGCKPAQVLPLIKGSAYIVGSNNMRPIDASRADAMNAPADGAGTTPALTPELEERIRKVAAASVLIVAPLSSGETRYCSGAAYKTESGVFIVSNRHCFATSKEHKVEESGVDPWACEKTKIYLDFDLATAMPGRRSGCANGSLRTNARLDLAVFRIDGAEPPATLTLRHKDPAPAERVPAFIVHFPDVEDKRIRMDLGKFPGAPATVPRMTVTFEDCRSSGYFHEEQHRFDPSLPYGIRHSCDMIKGSSGSSLIDAATGESIGINWGGIKFGDDPTAETYNIATRATLVTSFLAMPAAELDAYLVALAEKPQAEFTGDGTSGDATVERTSKRPLTAAGCAKIDQPESTSSGETHKNAPRRLFDDPLADLGWLALGFVIGAGLAWQRKRKRAREAIPRQPGRKLSA
jgi:hypothetical protein